MELAKQQKKEFVVRCRIILVDGLLFERIEMEIFTGRNRILQVLEGFIMEILKVSSKSIPNSVAGAVAEVVREKGSAEIQAIGAGAINQAVKAIAISRGFLAPAGIDLICIPAFADIDVDGEKRTAIRLILEQR